MITGFNTDVKYKGVIYHVQTEDKGTTNPLIETLIYRGGEILGSRCESSETSTRGGRAEPSPTAAPSSRSHPTTTWGSPRIRV